MSYFSDEMTPAEYRAFSNDKGLRGRGLGQLGYEKFGPALAARPPPPKAAQILTECKAGATALLNGGSTPLLPICYDRLTSRQLGVPCRTYLERLSRGTLARMPGRSADCISNPKAATVPNGELAQAKTPGGNSASPDGGTMVDDSGAGYGDAGGFPGEDTGGGLSTAAKVSIGVGLLALVGLGVAKARGMI